MRLFSGLLEKILELPRTVPGEQLKLKRRSQDPSLIPIDYYFCLKCSHVQLIHVPSTKKLWGKKYTFKPSDNPELIKHFSRVIGIKDGRKVIDCQPTNIKNDQLNELYN